MSDQDDLYAACLPSSEAPGQILLVDDDPDAWEILKGECEGHPFVLHHTSSGEAALKLCAERSFEGIILDVNLPDMSGIEVCQRIDEIPLNAQTPRIFLSASAKATEWLLVGLEAGAIDYLTWPYSPPELLAKLRVMVRLARQANLLAIAERTRILLEVTGGAAHELSQPLAAAQLLLDRWTSRNVQPGEDGLAQLQQIMTRVSAVLSQLRNLGDYASSPYPGGPILDLKASIKANQP